MNVQQLLAKLWAMPPTAVVFFETESGLAEVQGVDLNPHEGDSLRPEATHAVILSDCE